MPGADSPLHVVERGPRSGSGLPVVLVHGAMDRSSSFGRLLVELADRHVIAYDRRGYGRSLGRGPTREFADHVADLVEVLDGRRALAVGHSFGGGVVLAAAAARPDLIAGAVVWEPPMPWQDWWPDRMARSIARADDADAAQVAEEFMLAMVGRRIWERLPERTRMARRAEGPTLVAEMRSIAGPVWDPAGVAVPVIVGRGAESRPHHLRATAELAERLPRGRLATLPGCRHGAHLSHPRELAGLLRDVAARVEEAAPLGTGVAAAGDSPAVPEQQEESR